MYLQNKRYLDAYNRLLKEGGFYSTVGMSARRPESIFDEFSKEELNNIENSEHYKYCKQIHDKLSPVVELIGDSFPTLISEIETLLKKPDF